MFQSGKNAIPVLCSPFNTDSRALPLNPLRCLYSSAFVLVRIMLVSRQIMRTSLLPLEVCRFSVLPLDFFVVLSVCCCRYGAETGRCYKHCNCQSLSYHSSLAKKFRGDSHSAVKVQFSSPVPTFGQRKEVSRQCNRMTQPSK